MYEVHYIHFIAFIALLFTTVVPPFTIVSSSSLSKCTTHHSHSTRRTHCQGMGGISKSQENVLGDQTNKMRTFWKTGIYILFNKNHKNKSSFYGRKKGENSKNHIICVWVCGKRSVKKIQNTI